MINESFELGELPESVKKSVLVLIFKKGDKHLLKNYRPISLTNYDYKIIAFTLASRVQKTLPLIIHTDQSGYIKGRFIGNNIRVTCDIFELAEKFEKDGMIVCLDFEKAFDSIDWEFMWHVLTSFNFGDKFIQYVKILYTNPVITIKNNGWLSETFAMSRVVRQGCPLSALLFIMCVETLSLKLRSTPNVQGFKVGNNEFKVSQYADDTTLFLKNFNSLDQALAILNVFENVSGLKLNKAKCEGILLGNLKDAETEYNGIQFTNNPVKYLGIFIGHDKVKCEELNWLPKIKKLEACLEVWKSRKLTMFGKVLIVKALALSQITYTINVLCVPNYIVKLIEQCLYKFIWEHKDRIKRTTVIGEYLQGGLKMVDVKCKINAMRATWIKSMMQPQSYCRTIV